jgi:hypothetical protein
VILVLIKEDSKLFIELSFDFESTKEPQLLAFRLFKRFQLKEGRLTRLRRVFSQWLSRKLYNQPPTHRLTHHSEC